MNHRLLGIEPISDARRELIHQHLLTLPPSVPETIPPGHIQLDANPDDAPCCIKIVAADGRDLLVQTDWEFPAVAAVFGFSLADCKPPEPEGYYSWQQGRDCCGEPWTAEDEKVFADYEAFSCDHHSTDGTVTCQNCGMKAGRFIELAREWLDGHDGATAEDPGYF